MSTTARSSPGSMAPVTATAGGPGISHYIKPKTRQRIYKTPPAIDVPNINEDAAERKRLLNVLAQRRYSTLPLIVYPNFTTWHKLLIPK